MYVDGKTERGRPKNKYGDVMASSMRQLGVSEGNATHEIDLSGNVGLFSD